MVDSAESAVLTLSEAATFLKISERTLWSMVTDGNVPSFRIGRQHRFQREALEQWMRNEANRKFAEAAEEDAAAREEGQQ